jgi:hypothetical protein
MNIGNSNKTQHILWKKGKRELLFILYYVLNKGNNKITELRTILQIRVITKLPNSEQSYK